jgi:D-beta-D-heptose 7-phosphate kinase / D-beta-D-heptose 1-phosphate adenosyltransferase
MIRGRIVVVGDALLDVDLNGSASRLAPDAAVPVVDDITEVARPGGAALAASLLARDGLDVVLVTALGEDPSSRRLRAVLPAGVDVVEVPMRGELSRKVRVRAGAQSLARLDYGGGTVTLSESVRLGVRDVVESSAAILVSDYGQGVTRALRGTLADVAGRRAMVWDPHPRGAAPVPDASAVTPNIAEARAFAAVRTESTVTEATATDDAPLRRAAEDARVLVDSWRVRSVCITMGGAGALLSFGDDSPLVVPAPRVHCYDPCGAGDRFAGAFAAALAAGALPSEAAQCAVQAASAFVELGVARALASADPRPADPRAADPRLAEEACDSTDAFARIMQAHASGRTVVATGGCFDLLHAGHVETLRAARALGDFLVVCLNSDASVARLKGPGRPLVHERDRARVLQALECVDAVVVFDEDTPAALLQKIRPHIWAKGGDYGSRTLPEASVLSEWGGQAVLLPYLEGRSTTALVDAASKKMSVTKGVFR